MLYIARSIIHILLSSMACLRLYIFTQIFCFPVFSLIDSHEFLYFVHGFYFFFRKILNIIINEFIIRRISKNIKTGGGNVISSQKHPATTTRSTTHRNMCSDYRIDRSIHDTAYRTHVNHRMSLKSCLVFSHRAKMSRNRSHHNRNQS